MLKLEQTKNKNTVNYKKKLTLKKMNTYIINYDLKSPQKSYTKVHKAIKSYGSYSHLLLSTWIIKTGETIIEVKRKLARSLDPDDRLVVAELRGKAVTVGFKEEKLNKPKRLLKSLGSLKITSLQRKRIQRLERAINKRF